MKIKKLKINSYGKLHNIDINLKDSINIIYGNNESGKSTILKFILNSFYGSSRNKNGKDISDFEKYKPWEGDEFSGKLEYVLDNGEKYQIYREFNRKNPKIYNDEMEDISKQFNVNKKGNEFFYEQTKIDEELFLSTSAIVQQEVKIEKKMQTTLIQKIANLVGTGDDNVSFRRAMDRLNRRQLDEIGTERSREKPINLIESKMNIIKKRIEELKDFEQKEDNIEQEKIKIMEKISFDEVKVDALKKIKNLNEKNEIENEKINLQENLKNENNERIKVIKNEIKEINQNNKIEEEKIKNKEKIKVKKIKNKLNFLLLLNIIINFLQFIFIDNKLFNYIFLMTIPIFLTLNLFIKNKLKNRKKYNLEKDNKLIDLENELNLLQKNNNNLENEINNLKNELNIKYNLEIEKINKKYSEKMSDLEFQKINNLKNINYFIDKIQNEINNGKIKLHSLELNKENFDKNLEEKAILEEDLGTLSKQYVNLQKLNLSMNLAKEVLNSSYEKMKETVTPRFTEKLSNTISKITNREIQKC